MMLFDILTIFPDFFLSPLQEGIVRRAQAGGLIRVGIHNIRDFALDRHHMTDDRPFGGGEGMVMKPEPLASCLDSVRAQDRNGRVILLSPKGRPFSHVQAQRLTGYDQLILVCGRYEGVDERFRERCVDEEISIGDFILTGGELAALVVVDAVSRLLPGVLGCENSALLDSFSRGFLKHAQYTRPRVFDGVAVPEILLSGDHAAIAAYRFVESIKMTLDRRPELLAGVQFSVAEQKLLKRAGLENQIKTIARDDRKEPLAVD